MVRTGLLISSLAVMLLTSLPSRGEVAYPSERPIKLLVGFAAGGGADMVARTYAHELGSILGQTVVVDNRPGASATIAASTVARSAPDGYTLLHGHVSSNAMVPTIMKNIPKDAVKDFTPLVLIGRTPQVAAVPATLPVDTLEEFIDMVKKNPGKYNYASSGFGTQHHFAAELFKLATQTDIRHVPYKGSSTALVDLVAGRVDISFDSVTAIVPYLQAGTLRPLAVTSAERVKTLPDVPTMTEVGVPDYSDVGTWHMLMGPADMPQALKDQLVQAMQQTLRTPVVREKLESYGLDVAGGTPAEAQAFLSGEISRWKDVAERANIIAE